MADTDIEAPQAFPKGLRHGLKIAAITVGVPLPTIMTALGHANLQTTAVYTTAAGLKARDLLPWMWEKRGEFGRIWRLKASGEGL